MQSKISPLAMAVKTVDSVMQRHPVLMENWHYEVGVMLKAVDFVWKKTGNQAYFDYLKKNVDYFVEDNGNIRTYTVTEFNLDQINTGKAVLTVFRETGEVKYKKAADTLREQLKKHPRTSEGGFWHKQIYPSQMWLDGIYMQAPFYAEYASLFNEPKAYQDIANQFELLFKHARDPKTGLLYHAWNEDKAQQWANPETGCSPHFWGRAMGWYMMALVDTLDFIPVSAERDRLIDILQQLTKAVLGVQDRQNGLWYQVLDRGGDPGNYVEASASSMFVYALLKGLNRGYLDESMREAVQRGYNGIMEHFVEIGADGHVHLNGICSMAGLGKYKENMEYRDGSYEYYISEPVVADDYKGVGPFIMACTECK